ncbi:MAG: type ISP restriction/modification enzyme, partial [Prolixibacteraceae bacterium]
DRPGYGVNEQAGKTDSISQQLTLRFGQLQNIIFARMVQKVGDRRYWEQWAKDVAQIAERQIERINRLTSDDGEHKKAFKEFLTGLQKNINPSITASEAVEMLSQHIITKPVFEALFKGYSFVQNNAISVSMQKMLDLLEAKAIEKDTETLQKFYESVKSRAADIDNATGKQRIIVELYDKFFKTAFPKMVEKLGIVYTPVEVVDFIIHSVDHILQKEFGRSISDENIHILDPFTGTGTFITLLLQSGLIKPEDLERKYVNELHANEIVLLAYYIAAINIENAYHDLLNADAYKPFDGICLTDTFQLGETDESEKLFSEMFVQNSDRVIAQKKAPLRVIIGNPPYSIGQKSANDNAQNQSYPVLDGKIANSYAKESTAGLNKSLYDAYIKAFRWSTDRLDPEHGGIIAFVSNGAWLDGNSTDGFRKCLEKEFSAIYIFDLRGNQRTSGELSRKEGGKIFGSGSRTPIAITFLVKNPNAKSGKAMIHYHDIGDYLSREEKLGIINKFSSVDNPEMTWTVLKPNEHGDWTSQRNDVFGTFIPLAPEKKFDAKTKTVFKTYAIGVASNRDAWVYNFSKKEIDKNMYRMVDFYNQQKDAFLIAKQNNPNLIVENFIVNDPKKISWTRALRNDIKNNIVHNFQKESHRTASYRPFCKHLLYYDVNLIESPGLSPKLFPKSDIGNKVICITGMGSNKDFSVLIVDCIPDLQILMNGQCFPLYYYEERKKESLSLFDECESNSDFIQKDGISDFILQQAIRAYGKSVTKEDIFYYVYGFLHCSEYRTQFASDLRIMLPCIPLVDEPRDFWSFSKAGRKLADLHLNYETVPAFEGVTINGETPSISKILNDNQPSHNEDDYAFYLVEKMRFPKKDQKDTIFYNSHITIQNIPAQAYSYIVNGKSAIEWIMERYQITTHKDSAIRNDPNDWSRETNNPRYILNLLLSIINVSLQTVGIVKSISSIKR